MIKAHGNEQKYKTNIHHINILNYLLIKISTQDMVKKKFYI